MASGTTDFWHQPVHAPVGPLIHPFFEQARVTVHLKREDLIHPFISGNKWRKLKYTLAEAKATGKQRLVTFGGAYSNHILAVACAGAKAGLATQAYIRGEEPMDSHVLVLCRVFGMELIQVSRSAYRDKDHLTQKAQQHPHTLVIPEGGTNALAVKGCAEMVADLEEDYDHVVVAVGTGGTLAGLAAGFAQKTSKTQISGVVVLRGATYLENVLEELVPGLSNWQLHHEFHRGGYAKTDPELMTFIQTFATQTGVLLDQVYTAKAMLALKHWTASGTIAPRSKVLFIHTGGLWGLVPQLLAQ